MALTPQGAEVLRLGATITRQQTQIEAALAEVTKLRAEADDHEHRGALACHPSHRLACLDAARLLRSVADRMERALLGGGT